MRLQSGIVLLGIASLFTIFYSQAQTPEHINPDLLSRKWSARWISHPDIQGSEYGVYLFRKEINLATIPEHFRVHVSADNRYKLFVNGTYICNGPARGHLVKWNFESLDLAPFLKEGKNIIAAQVWNFAEQRPLAQLSAKTGFLLQGNAATEGDVNTNSSWLVCRDSAYAPLRVTIPQYYVCGPGEVFQGSAHPWGWMLPDTDTRLWKKAKVVEDAKPVYCLGEMGGTAPHLLQPRNIPMMEERPQRFAVIRRTDLSNLPEGFVQGGKDLLVPPASKVRILFDQGRLTNAYPVLTYSGGAQSKIRLTYAESLTDPRMGKGNRNDILNKTISGVQDIIVCDGGSGRVFQTLWWRTFRYVELEIQTTDAPLILNDFHSIFTAYPFRENASFTSDNPLLSRIWEAGWRTQRLCAHETYFDCPYYEQLQYIGDTRIQGLITSYVDGDPRLIRSALQLWDDSRLPLGITQSRYPAHEVQLIPTYSLAWIATLHDYWMLHDDPEFVRSMIPGILSILNWYEARLDSTGMLGKVDWWNFVDWVSSRSWNTGMPPEIHTGNSSVVSLLYVYSLQKASELLEAFDMKDQAARLTEQSQLIQKAVYHLCFDPAKGLIADSPRKTSFSQHANALAISTNTIAAKDQPGVMKALLSDKDLAQCTLYFRFFLFEALEHAGMADGFVALLDPWQKMLESGLTTFAETPDPTRSDCHAWSASPLYFLLSSVCGMHPAEPGFRSVLIEPHPGALKQIKGIMPHPKGKIEVNLQQGVQGRLTGEINLPKGLSGTYRHQGKQIALKGGSNRIL